MIVGAQKAGTTWWYWLMANHPGIHAVSQQRPELHVFDRMPDRWPTDAEIARYKQFFPRPAGSLAGEKTPEYLARHWVPAMLRVAAPDARLIALVRDPIERFRSGIVHTEDALANRGIEPSRMRSMVTDDAFHRGLYAAQLARLTIAFPADRCLVLQFEQCIREPQQQLDRVFRFLGLPPHTLSQEALSRRDNRTRSEKPELAPERHRVLVELYTPDVLELVRLVPDLDLTLWPNFAHLDQSSTVVRG